MLRNLVDPNAASLRSGPRDERDLFIAANNSWVITLDNLSHLPDWLSDALCRVATGGGLATRLYVRLRDSWWSTFWRIASMCNAAQSI